MYNMEIKQAEKIFLINVSGFIKEDEAVSYMKDLNSYLTRIPNKSDYHFIINGKEQKTVSAEVQNILSEALDIYVKTPFKSHHTVTFDSATSKSQIMRAGSTEFANKFNFHDTLESALNSCK